MGDVAICVSLLAVVLALAGVTVAIFEVATAVRERRHDR